MRLHKDIMPLFRDADECGLIGARGYLNYFQDVVTEYMHNVGKGNDTLPEEYGIVWMVTKYRIQVEQETDFTGMIRLDTWAEPGKQKAIVNQDLVVSRGDCRYAAGRMEMCLFDLNKKGLTRLSAIDLPEDLAEKEKPVIDSFTRLSPDLSFMTKACTHKVTYTDLDKTGHMTNLRYVNLLLDAFPASYYRKRWVKDLEIHYLSQCYEGETLTVFVTDVHEEGWIDLSIVKEDGTAAIQGRMQVLPR